MDVLHWLSQNLDPKTLGAAPAIIPTVLIPLTFLTVGITSIAGMIAGWFGIKLKAEGPKQFLEVLLKKRIILTMIFFNLSGWGLFQTYKYIKNLPSFIYTIEKKSLANAIASDAIYPESLYRNHDFIGQIVTRPNLALELVKEIKLKKGAFRSGLVSGDSIFYGVDDGLIYEINKHTLDIKRTFYVGTQVSTRPIIYQNKLYVGEGTHDTHHARIYSFDLQNGNYLQSFSTKGHTEGQPVIVNYQGHSIMLITAGSDGLYAIDPQTMKELWHKKNGHIDATVTEEKGIVYAGTGIEKGLSRDKSYAYAYHIKTGEEIWKTELPFSSWMHPIVTSLDVCYILGEIYLPSKVGALHCLNKLTGNPHFSIPFDTPIASKPFYIRENNKEIIFFGDMNGTIYGIDINTREKMWSQKTSEIPTSSALTSLDYDTRNGLLWYPTYANGIMAIEPKTGKILLHWKPKSNSSVWGKNYAAVSLDQNYLYHMDIEGHLRKFKITTHL